MKKKTHLRPTEAAAALDITRQNLDMLIRRGHIATEIVAVPTRMIPVAAVEKYRKSRPEKVSGGKAKKDAS